MAVAEPVLVPVHCCHRLDMIHVELFLAGKYKYSASKHIFTRLARRQNHRTATMATAQEQRHDR
jgi:hypothetical protein